MITGLQALGTNNRNKSIDMAAFYKYSFFLKEKYCLSFLCWKFFL